MAAGVGAPESTFGTRLKFKFSREPSANLSGGVPDLSSMVLTKTAQVFRCLQLIRPGQTQGHAAILWLELRALTSCVPAF